jgi:hypothetical protein
MELDHSARTHPTPKSMKLVLIRANGALFYSVAAAAVLEADAARTAGRVLSLFGSDARLCEWLKSEWLPCRRARARLLREYVEQTWPEFDFAAALHEYAAASDDERGCGPQRTPAHEALARCVSASQAALFYGALGRWAEDGRLREAASACSREESDALARFRAIYEQSARAGMRWPAAWFAARRMMRRCRDVQLPFLYTCLAAHWRPHAPIAEMSYRDFVRRMRGVVRSRGKPGWAERAVFAPWARRPRVRLERTGRAATNRPEPRASAVRLHLAS